MLARTARSEVFASDKVAVVHVMNRVIHASSTKCDPDDDLLRGVDCGELHFRRLQENTGLRL